MKYTLISGFHRYNASADWFLNLWLDNIKAISFAPERVFVNCVDSSLDNIVEENTLHKMADSDVRWIGLSGNLMHVHNLIGKAEPAVPYAYCGWSGCILAGALLAYNNCTDYVFCEQDVLMFGDCIGQMYRELNGTKMIFGKNKLMGCAQSLFLIKHDWIPEFVKLYLTYGNDRSTHTLPEHRFMMLLQRHQRAVKQFSFPFDRDRPLDMSLPVWYCQKTTPEELLKMRDLGLIEFDNLPDANVFSSQA